MTPSEIVNLVVTVASVIPTLVSVVALIVNIVKNKNWKLVTEILDTAMAKVEEHYKAHPEMTSEQKLNMALDITKSSLSVAGIKCDEALLKRCVEYIKQSIDWFNGMTNGRA